MRNPATLCGISALRPSPGWIPLGGVTPLSPHFDVVGPMARSARELRALLAVLAGRALPPAPAAPLRGLRVGVPEPFFYDDVRPDVGGGCDALLALLEASGARLRPVRLPTAAEPTRALAVLANAQAAEVHRERLQDERVSLALGRAVTVYERGLARWLGGQCHCPRWRRAALEAFAAVDLLVVPASPRPAPRIGSGHLIAVSAEINRTNAAWSLARLPALSVPCLSRALPVGAHLVGPPHSDWRVLDAGAAIQRESDWHERRPAAAAHLPMPGVSPQ